MNCKESVHEIFQKKKLFKIGNERERERERERGWRECISERTLARERERESNISKKESYRKVEQT